MFDEFDTIKHIKNFPKYGVWYGHILKKVRYGTVWSCLVLFGFCDDINSRKSLYKNFNFNFNYI